jgi:Spy/CpxP family protein refolding chaperone
MKTLKILPLITGALMAAAIAMSPVAALAQGQGQGQQQQQSTEIVLSAEQQAKFKEIRAQTLASIAKVLTPAQMDLFQKEGPMALKDLTDPQKAELQKIFETYIVSIRGILTKEQLQQIEQAQPDK